VNLKEMLKAVDTVLVIDWPTKEVPEMLAHYLLGIDTSNPVHDFSHQSAYVSS
jgi:hypothetical protein